MSMESETSAGLGRACLSTELPPLRLEDPPPRPSRGRAFWQCLNTRASAKRTVAATDVQQNTILKLVHNNDLDDLGTEDRWNNDPGHARSKARNHGLPVVFITGAPRMPMHRANN